MENNAEALDLFKNKKENTVASYTCGNCAQVFSNNQGKPCKTIKGPCNSPADRPEAKPNV